MLGDIFGQPECVVFFWKDLNKFFVDEVNHALDYSMEKWRCEVCGKSFHLWDAPYEINSWLKDKICSYECLALRDDRRIARTHLSLKSKIKTKEWPIELVDAKVHQMRLKRLGRSLSK